MTNKRFIFELVEISDVDNDVDDILVEVITDKEKNYSYGELDEVEGVLNNLHQENTELKEAIDYLKTVIRYTIPNEMVADVFKRIGEEYD